MKLKINKPIRLLGLALVKPYAVSEAYHYMAVPLGSFGHDSDEDAGNGDDDYDDDDLDVNRFNVNGE